MKKINFWFLIMIACFAAISIMEAVKLPVTIICVPLFLMTFSLIMALRRYFKTIAEGRCQ